MTAPSAYLRCDRCDVRWETGSAEPCWMCGGAGTPSRQSAMTATSADQSDRTMRDEGTA